jgi:plastocyanin
VNLVFCLATPPAPPAKTLRGAGPIIVIILVVAAAFVGYYQILYYPTIAPHSSATTTSSIGPLEKVVVVTIPQGAQSPSTPSSQTYLPNVITIYIGYNATVMWVNNDTAAHTVTAKGTAPDPRFNQFGPSSPPYNNINPGQNVTFTFTVAGTYPYVCSYHNWMSGTVIVKPALASLTASSSVQTSTKSTTTTNST